MKSGICALWKSALSFADVSVKIRPVKLLDFPKSRQWLFAYCTLFICLLLPLIPPFGYFEAATEDLRFALRGPRVSKSAHRIFLATISDDTMEHWKLYPIVAWGGHVAEALAGAKAAEARVVGLDFIPAMDTDAYLSFVAKEALRLAGRPEKEITRLEGKFTTSPILQPDTALVGFLLQNPGFVVLADNGQLIKPLQTVDAPISRVDLPDQRDGVVRIMQKQRDGVSYFATTLARLMGAAPGKQNAYGINYVALTPAVTFQQIPLEKLTNPSIQDRKMLKGACVIIGFTYSFSNDLHLGVLRRPFPGMEIHAQALATILDGAELHRGSVWSEFFWTAFLGLFGIVGFKLNRIMGFVFYLPMVGIWLAIAQWWFAAHNFWLPIAAPILAILLPITVFSITPKIEAVYLERRSRLLVERIFGQYLSPTVRDYLLADPQHRELGGMDADATVLFFDLRGSTAFAEEREPKAVLAELNRLFSKVVPILQRHDGTVLRYSGDGFMAVFGAPSPSLEHASQAIAAIRDISHELSVWNIENKRLGETAWQFGMGLHSGHLVWGNLGTSDRPEITLIGDTVNIAARLQDATKALDADVVMSKATWQKAGEPDDFEGPLIWDIRGRREGLTIYFLRKTM